MKKLCINCKHCNNGTFDSAFARCRHPKNNEIKSPSLVDGEAKYLPNLIYCDSHRSTPRMLAFLYGACGVQGRWYEEKDSEK